MARAVTGDGEGGDVARAVIEDNNTHNVARTKVPSLVAHQRHPPIGLPLLVVL